MDRSVAGSEMTDDGRDPVIIEGAADERAALIDAIAQSLFISSSLTEFRERLERDATLFDASDEGACACV